MQTIYYQHRNMALWNLVLLLLIQNFYEVVFGSFNVNLQLIHYEATPRDCCDGSRLIMVGPLKCNECDVFFKVCAKAKERAQVSCTTTTRQDDSHSIDIQHSHIRPTAFQWTFTDWEGLIYIDLEIIDYDAVGKNDDIDHIYYKYNGPMNSNYTRIALQGSMATVTADIKVACSDGFYGPSCEKYCRNARHGRCSEFGELICQQGYIGLDCSVMAASVPNLSVSYPKISTATPTSATKNSEHLPNLVSKMVTKPQAITFSTPNKVYTAMVTTETTPTIIKTTTASRPVLLSSHVTTAAIKAATTMEAKSGLVNTTMSQTSSKTTEMKTRAISWSNSHMQLTASIHTSISKFTPLVSKTAEKTTPKASTFTHLNASDKGHESITIAEVLVPEESKPDGMERNMTSVTDYTSIVLLGDQRGSTKIVQNAILTSLCSNNKYKDPSLIRINIATQYVYTENGSIATALTFQVRFMGNLLTSSEVHTALYTDSNTSLPNVLKSMNLEQIEPNPHEQGQQQETENNESWIEKNVVILAVTGGILLTICIGTGIFFARRKGNDREKEWSMVVYDNKRKSSSLSTDPTVYLENPLYNVYSENSSTSES